jgi:heme exporter protein A
VSLCAEGVGLVRGGRWLACQISFTLPPGTALVVQGPNGCGKSTLLRTLCGLSRAHQGQVSWKGRSLPQAQPALAQDLAYLGHADSVHPDLTPAEHLDATLALAGEPSSAGERAAALAQAGLADCRGLRGRHLSQGQKRRAVLARFWLTRRPLWILDEPLAALDVQAREGFIQRMREHLAMGGCAVLACHTESWTRTDLPLLRLHWAN